MSFAECVKLYTKIKEKFTLEQMELMEEIDESKKLQIELEGGVLTIIGDIYWNSCKRYIWQNELYTCELYELKEGSKNFGWCVFGENEDDDSRNGDIDINIGEFGESYNIADTPNITNNATVNKLMYAISFLYIDDGVLLLPDIYEDKKQQDEFIERMIAFYGRTN